MRAVEYTGAHSVQTCRASVSLSWLVGVLSGMLEANKRARRQQNYARGL
jgi:hypothetical protein